MKKNFGMALKAVLVHEGGYVNHPADPGGATNKGITWRTYNAWRRNRGLPDRHVKNITDEEVAAIYKAQYWNVIRGDDLPSGLDYAVFDFAVNSGPARAAKFLQRIVNVNADGQIGQITLEAVAKANTKHTINALCDNRLAWLQRLRHWGTFGRGWTRRVQEVKAMANEMASNRVVTLGNFAQQGKATGPVTVTASLTDVFKQPELIAAGASLIGSGASVANGNGPVQYGLAAVLVVVAVVGLIYFIRKVKED